jgi:glycine betaine transporter
MTQQGVETERSQIGVVFWVSSAVALAFILWGVIAPTSFGTVTQAVFDWVVSNLGWFYLLAGNFFLVFVVVLALSRYGSFRLGKEGDRPEFGTFAAKFGHSAPVDRSGLDRHRSFTARFGPAISPGHCGEV